MSPRRSPTGELLDDDMERARKEWMSRNDNFDGTGLGALLWMALRGIYGYEGPDGEDTGLEKSDE